MNILQQEQDRYIYRWKTGKIALSLFVGILFTSHISSAALPKITVHLVQTSNDTIEAKSKSNFKVIICPSLAIGFDINKIVFVCVKTSKCFSNFIIIERTKHKKVKQHFWTGTWLSGILQNGEVCGSLVITIPL